jgi:hypothetical protein
MSFPKMFFSALFAAALLFCAADAQAAMEGPAPQSSTVNYNNFHAALAAHGQWLHNGRWGDVWRPGVAGFRPYFDRGHWAYTADYGWYWNADDDWGDIVFHYGRWVFDPAMGWVWIPGYVWGPGWAVWRWGGGFAGWMPEPPDFAFLTGAIDLSLGFGSWNASFYGYRNWYGSAVAPGNLWFFVGAGHLADPAFARFAVPQQQVAGYIARTRNVTHFALHNGFVVNRSIDVRSVERLSGHPIAAVSARTLVHSRFTAIRAAAGTRIARTERANHPLPANTVKSVRQARATTTVRTAHGITRHVTHTTRSTSRTMHRHTAHATGGHHYATAHARSYARHNYRTRSTAHLAGFHASGFARQTYHPATHGMGGGSHGAPSHGASSGHPSGKPPGK